MKGGKFEQGGEGGGGPGAIGGEVHSVTTGGKGVHGEERIS